MDNIHPIDAPPTTPTAAPHQVTPTRNSIQDGRQNVGQGVMNGIPVVPVVPTDHGVHVVTPTSTPQRASVAGQAIAGEHRTPEDPNEITNNDLPDVRAEYAAARRREFEQTEAERAAAPAMQPIPLPLFHDLGQEGPAYVSLLGRRRRDEDDQNTPPSTRPRSDTH